MPLVDVADDTFVAAPPAVLAPRVADPRVWRRWWPDLELEVTRDRGVKGHQWLARPSGVRPGRRGGWAGTLEVWLEPWGDGTVVHHYQRLDPAGGSPPPSPRSARREHRRRVLAWKRAVHALKDEVERGRRPGEPAVGRVARGLKDVPRSADDVR